MRRENCSDCTVPATPKKCKHGKFKAYCNEGCSGRYCEHTTKNGTRRRRSACAECNGGSLCGHMATYKYNDQEMTANLRRSRCKTCLREGAGGGSLCAAHKRIKVLCALCSPHRDLAADANKHIATPWTTQLAGGHVDDSYTSEEDEDGDDSDAYTYAF